MKFTFFFLIFVILSIKISWLCVREGSWEVAILTRTALFTHPAEYIYQS